MVTLVDSLQTDNDTVSTIGVLFLNTLLTVLK